jgi:hypothetical protein
MKCAAYTKNGTLCNRNHKSGCTVESSTDHWVYYLCAQHYDIVFHGDGVRLDKNLNRGHKLVVTTKEPGPIAQAYINKEVVPVKNEDTNRYNNMSIEDIAKLIDLQHVGHWANNVYNTCYEVDSVYVNLANSGQAHDNSRPGDIFNGSLYIAQLRPDLGVIMFNRGDEAVAFPIDLFLKTAEDEGEPPEDNPWEDYGQDDDRDDCSDEKPFIVAGTGSRSLKVADPKFKAKVVTWTRARLQRLQGRYGNRLVIMSGMAEGWDELLAMLARELGIRLWVYIPNKGYVDYYWGPTDPDKPSKGSRTGRDRREAAKSLVDYAEKVEYTVEDRLLPKGIEATAFKCPIPDKPGTTEHSNYARNRAMVEDADVFLVWDPSSSGTAHCFGLIKKSGKLYEICNTKVS